MKEPGSGEDATPNKRPLTVKDALFRVERDGLWGLYDGMGKELVPVQYKSFKLPDSGIEWVRVEDKGGKIGVVNFRTGKTIAVAYDYLAMYPGFILANNKSDNVYILFNDKGEEAARFEGESTEWFDDAGVLAVKLNGKYALFDKTGKQLCPFRYDDVYKATGPFVWGKMEKKEEPLNGKPVVYWVPEPNLAINYLVNTGGANKALIDGTGREYRIGLP